MSMAFSCAGARLHGRTGVGGAKCRPGAAALLGRRGSCFRPTARRWSTAAPRGIRADLPPPPRASADGGAAISGPAAVAVPEAGDATEQVAAVAQPVVLPERLDVDDGAGGNGKLPPAGGGGGGDGENGGGTGGGGDGDDGEDEFGPILSFDQVVQEAEKRGVSLPSLPADMVEAAKSVGIQKLLLLRYMDMQVS